MANMSVLEIVMLQGAIVDALENGRRYGKAWMVQAANDGLEEWRTLDFSAFEQALANADSPVFFNPIEKTRCIQHLSAKERTYFENNHGDHDLYSAAVTSAWDTLQRLIEAV